MKIQGKMEYNGKVVIFTSDRDCSFWVNNEETRFEDESPVSTEDIVELLTFYGHELIKRRSKRQYKFRVWFWDDESRLILFDDNGDPVIRIEDGKICSASYDCICDKTFPMYGVSRVHSGMGKDNYQGFKSQVEASGIFDKGKKKRKMYGYDMIYLCKTCGNEWVLSSPGSFEMWGWEVKKRLEQRA